MKEKSLSLAKINQFIGEKIYALRVAQGLSREQLGALIGISSYQLQKYEKGVNKISVGRLLIIAKALSKEINYFYEGIDDPSPTISYKQPNKHQRMCLEVSRNFMKMDNLEHQNAINILIKSLV